MSDPMLLSTVRLSSYKYDSHTCDTRDSYYVPNLLGVCEGRERNQKNSEAHLLIVTATG
jgi:hypothetical protein